MKASQLDRDLYCLRCAGYLILPSQVPTEVVDRIAHDAARFEDEVIRFTAAGGEMVLKHFRPLRTTRGLYAISREVQDVAMNARLQAIVTGYLEDAVLRDCVLQTNLPDARNAARGIRGDVSYHRDALWTDEAIAPLYLHAFLFLDDCTRENGATLVVPGSHRQREPGYYFKDTDPRASTAGMQYRVYERDYFASAVHLEAARGALVFMDPMLIHTQGLNVTAEPRRILNASFKAAAAAASPKLLDARLLAQRHARVPIRPDLLAMLESDPERPSRYGPLGNSWPQASCSSARTVAEGGGIS